MIATAKQVVQNFVVEKPLTLVTAPNSEGALAGALRELTPRHSPGVYSAVLSPRKRAEQLGLFS